MHKLELLYALTLRDIQAKFKQSIIGIGWALAQPLALMFVFDLVFSRLLKTDSEGAPYPIFVYACLLPWTFFAAAVVKGTCSIEANSGLIKKVTLNRFFYPVSAVLSCLVDFGAASLVFIAMLFWYHTALNAWALMVVPLIALLITLAIGIALLLGALNTYLRDVKYALPLGIQLWFYASPIVYAISVVPPNLQFWYNLNPIAGLMVGFRNVLVKGIAPDWELLGISVLVTAIVGVIGYLVFKRLEGNFADIV